MVDSIHSGFEIQKCLHFELGFSLHFQELDGFWWFVILIQVIVFDTLRVIIQPLESYHCHESFVIDWPNEKIFKTNFEFNTYSHEIFLQIKKGAKKALKKL